MTILLISVSNVKVMRDYFRAMDVVLQRAALR